MLNFIISPNSYEDFTGLLDEIKSAGKSFTWFYPYEGDKLPEVPGNLVKYMKPIRADM